MCLNLPFGCIDWFDCHSKARFNYFQVEIEHTSLCSRTAQYILFNWINMSYLWLGFLLSVFKHFSVPLTLTILFLRTLPSTGNQMKLKLLKQVKLLIWYEVNILNLVSFLIDRWYLQQKNGLAYMQVVRKDMLEALTPQINNNLCNVCYSLSISNGDWEELMPEHSEFDILRASIYCLLITFLLLFFFVGSVLVFELVWPDYICIVPNCLMQNYKLSSHI